MWLPPKVSRELREETMRHQFDVLSMSHLGGVLEEWTRELRRIDPCLQLIKADAQASAPGLIPGFYHVLRIPPVGPPSLFPVTDGFGGFAEPTSRLFDMLRAQDLWNDEAVKDRRRMDEAAGEARRKAAAREAEERQQEILERWKAATQVSVSMNKGKRAWTQTAGAKRAA